MLLQRFNLPICPTALAAELDHYTKHKVPVILMGVEFWQPLARWIRETLQVRGLVGKDDLKLLHITDDLNTALRLIRTAGDRIEGGG